MTSRWIMVAALSGFLAVAMGAFGAHGLKAVLDEAALGWVETAVRYHFWHTLALGLVGVLALRFDKNRALQCAGWGFILGTVLFSGSLYMMALTGIRAVGWVTPLGGLAFLFGWGSLGFFGLTRRRKVRP